MGSKYKIEVLNNLLHKYQDGVIVSSGHSVGGGVVQAQQKADTVPELDIDKYVGRWYQAYGNRFGWLSYGDDAICITATYTIADETTVSVYNHNRVSRGDGEERSIGGTATKTAEPGQFVLRLV